jgi:Xaa-Pro dipeptidase
MTLRELDVLVIFSPANVYYLTGHHSIDSWEFRALVVTHDREPALLLYSFERGRFVASSWLADAIFYGPTDDPVAHLAEAIEDLRLTRARVGLELNASNLNVATYQRIEARLNNADLIGADRLVDRIRLVKSDAELACVHRAAELTNIGLRAAREAVRPGAFDYEIVAAAADAMFRAGSHQLVMQPTVAVGYRSGLSHSQHNGVQAQTGDSVFIELSGNYRHYSAPIMYTTTIGPVDDERNEFLDVAHRTAETIIEHAKPGVRACDVAAKALDPIRSIENRIQFHYVFGYSVGISFPPHWLEESYFHIRATNEEPLQAGMVFHLPLTMRVLGKYGAGTSRTIEIAEHGARMLTGGPNADDS